MGNVNPQSVPRLQEDVQKSMYDAILHVGDFAYNFDTVSFMEIIHLINCLIRTMQGSVMNLCVKLNQSQLMFLT